MRQSAHFILSMLSVVPWAVGNVFYAISAGFMYAAFVVLPNSRFGNCWGYSVPRWLKLGGYLSIRVAEDVRFLKLFPVLHVQWMRKTPHARSIKQFIPVVRVANAWLPWRTLYFRGRAVSADTNHDAKDEK